jgi:hypothetical protein
MTPAYGPYQEKLHEIRPNESYGDDIKNAHVSKIREKGESEWCDQRWEWEIG